MPENGRFSRSRAPSKIALDVKRLILSRICGAGQGNNELPSKSQVPLPRAGPPSRHPPRKCLAQAMRVN